MATVNETLRDGILRHQIGLHRLTVGEVEKTVRLLKDVEVRVANQLRQRLAVEAIVGVDRGPATTRRLRIILADIRTLLIEAYAEIGDKLQLRLFEAAEREAAFMERMLTGALPNDLKPFLTVGVPSVDLLREIVSKRPFQNALLGQYFNATGKPSLVKVAVRRYSKAIMGDVRAGLVEGKTVESVVRGLIKRVRGLTRNDLRAVTDTAIKHATQGARDAFFDANSGDDGVIKGYQWVSTLDERTTEEICVPRDGKRYDLKRQPIGHSLPWKSGPGRIHWRCRSTSIAILKSWQELGIPAKEISGQTRASMNGQVPASLTVEEVRKRAA